jgi:hypothetical protein
MLIKKIAKPVLNDHGAALLLVLVMLTALLGAAGWLGLQTRTETAIVTAVKDYSKSFNAADGSWWLSLFYFRKVDRGREFSVGTPKLGGSEIAVKSNYKNYLNSSQFQKVAGSSEHVETMGRVVLMRTLDTVLEGYDISSSGYETPVTVWYQLVGEAKFKFVLNDGTELDKTSTRMSAIVLRVQ